MYYKNIEMCKKSPRRKEENRGQIRVVERLKNFLFKLQKGI
jgi:hypothetical protein